ncbi:MAG: 4Fe-4S binding protein [Chloroflexi bacterium]|nr:4Fe-4S binding protein [Chloroflexota bacterium]
MQAFYGFKDGSGDWFVIIDTDKCDGCGKCVAVCPANVLEVDNNEYDPLSEEIVAKVREAERKKVRYSCAGCHPGYGEGTPPCVVACEAGAISHSEGWKLMYGR